MLPGLPYFFSMGMLFKQRYVQVADFYKTSESKKHIHIYFNIQKTTH